MEWLLMALVLLAIVVNIRSFMVLAQFQRQRRQMTEDTEALRHSMEQFVATIEAENDELYSKLADTMKRNENRLEERMRKLEKRQEAAPVIETDAQTVPPPAEAAEPGEELHGTAKIEQLHKQGFSAKQIAKLAGAERGEVELVINMMKKKQSYQK